MRGFLLKGQNEHMAASQSAETIASSESAPQEPPDGFVTDEVFAGYLSDIEDDTIEDWEEAPADKEEEEEHFSGGDSESDAEEDSDEREASKLDDIPESMFHVQPPPSRKRRRHAIPVRLARKKQKLQVQKDLELALVMIEKHIASKTELFASGRNGLQAYRARAIQSHLHMVVRNSRKHIDASQRAAESQGFAPNWGGRLVRRWVKLWVQKRELPMSHRGAHGKVYSLLDDPAIRAELRSYLRTNKWSMDPAKLAEYTKTTSIPAAAEKYVRQVVEEEMPAGLKKYMELELFPRIHYRTVGKGVSLETARQFLHKEGFKFTEHKKALYYDGCYT